jgi:hypothetical protein
MSDKVVRKDCIRCGRRRRTQKFGNHASTKDGLRRWCRDCEAKSAAERHPYFRRYRAEKRDRLEAYKASKGCSRCGEADPACLQFHHRDPDTKDRTISRMYGRTWSWPRIEAEIAKCDVLCANCHLKLHRKEDSDVRIA